MPRIPVAQLTIGTRLRQAPFLLQDRNVREIRDGVNMLLVTLVDRSGSIGGVYHEVPNAVIASLPTAKGVEVTGYVNEYRGRMQVAIERIAPIELDNLEEYLPASRRPMDEMQAELDALLADVADPHLARLLGAFFDEPDMRKAFVQAPAAKRYHHACYGGLLEHTLAVARIVLTATDLYEDLDPDLAVTVALLHDIGKVRSYDPITFALTEEGVLFNHLPLGAMMVSEAIGALPEFPADLRLRVIHAILAHHGEPEKGSPVRPKTVEAMVLHYADNLDGDAQGAIDHFERSEEGIGPFTAYSTMHEGELYRGEQ